MARRIATHRSARIRLQLTGACHSRPRARNRPVSRAARHQRLLSVADLPARPGSTHGYDICDHNQINAELGGDGESDASRRARRAGIGQILDIVPNHMASTERRTLVARRARERAELARARASSTSTGRRQAELTGKRPPPILGDQYGHVLERGELRLGYAEGALELHYVGRIACRSTRADRRRSCGTTSTRCSAEWATTIRPARVPEHPVRARKHAAARRPSPEAIAERQREKEVARERLAAARRALARRSAGMWTRRSPPFNGAPGDPELRRAPRRARGAAYRLAYWRTAAHEINYRRFFDITSSPACAWRTRRSSKRRTRLPVRPHRTRTRHRSAGRPSRRPLRSRGDTSPSAGACRRAPGERARRRRPARAALHRRRKDSVGLRVLADAWAVDGTTGYGFLNEVSGLFVDRDRHGACAAIYTRFTGCAARSRTSSTRARSSSSTRRWRAS